MENKKHIVVLGCGAAGLGVAYALKDKNCCVDIIDKLPGIGGTHLNAWVNVHAATPAPPFLDPILKEMIEEGSACYVNSNYEVLPQEGMDYYKSYFTANLIGETESIGICFNIDKMRERYSSDFRNTNVKFLLNTTFVGVGSYENGKVKSIIVSDKKNGQRTVEADIFIDCSGDDVLIRSLGEHAGGCYAGVDSLDRYEKKYGFKEEYNTNTENTASVNDPTLIYRVGPGEEDLSEIQELPPNDALVYKDPVKKYLFVNTIDYLVEPGDAVYLRPDGEKEVYQRLVQKTIRHWKVIKNGNAPRFAAYPLHKMCFDQNAPMLGVRETYRALCERMLSVKDLFEQVSLETLEKREGLDCIIAVGCHPVDIHDNAAKKDIDVGKISWFLKMYGVSYGSIVPLKLKNVLVASRGAGFTHIAASSFRLNKNMMQLGWVAGKASLLFKDDFREIDFKELQNSIGIRRIVELAGKYFRPKK